MTKARIVVMGVSGSGKTTVGEAVAARLGLPFVDGDALHPPANIAKMRSGIPLEDADRWSWLDLVARTLAEAPAGAVVACSALRRAYRNRIRRGVPGCRFLYLALNQAAADARLAARTGHFMPESLVASQYATLEVPDPSEADIVTVDASLLPDAVVAWALDRGFGGRSDPPREDLTGV